MWYPLLTSLRNRGELAEGWYDPATLHKAAASAGSPSRPAALGNEPGRASKYGDHTKSTDAEASSDEDIVGPSLPNNISEDKDARTRPGPAIPNLQDLDFQRGMFVNSRFTDYLFPEPMHSKPQSKSDASNLQNLPPSKVSSSARRYANIVL